MQRDRLSVEGRQALNWVPENRLSGRRLAAGLDLQWLDQWSESAAIGLRRDPVARTSCLPLQTQSLIFFLLRVPAFHNISYWHKETNSPTMRLLLEIVSTDCQEACCRRGIKPFAIGRTAKADLAADDSFMSGEHFAVAWERNMAHP
jgi:hypothetical protein